MLGFVKERLSEAQVTPTTYHSNCLVINHHLGGLKIRQKDYTEVFTEACGEFR